MTRRLFTILKQVIKSHTHTHKKKKSWLTALDATQSTTDKNISKQSIISMCQYVHSSYSQLTEVLSHKLSAQTKSIVNKNETEMTAGVLKKEKR